jgi:hypothetical protein
MIPGCASMLGAVNGGRPAGQRTRSAVGPVTTALGPGKLSRMQIQPEFGVPVAKVRDALAQPSSTAAACEAVRDERPSGRAGHPTLRAGAAANSEQRQLERARNRGTAPGKTMAHLNLATYLTRNAHDTPVYDHS